MNVEVGEYVLVGDSAEMMVVDYPHLLLNEAQDLIARRQFGIAVVVAHMACEVAVERALSATFATRSIEYLEKPVRAFLNGYSLHNERLRNLYTALTGDAIHDEPFWAQYTESAKRRNHVVHQGRTATEVEAHNSHEVATAFVNHVVHRVSMGATSCG